MNFQALPLDIIVYEIIGYMKMEDIIKFRRMSRSILAIVDMMYRDKRYSILEDIRHLKYYDNTYTFTVAEVEYHLVGDRIFKGLRLVNELQGSIGPWFKFGHYKHVNLKDHEFSVDEWNGKYKNCLANIIPNGDAVVIGDIKKQKIGIYTIENGEDAIWRDHDYDHDHWKIDIGYEGIHGWGRWTKYIMCNDYDVINCDISLVTAAMIYNEYVLLEYDSRLIAACAYKYEE